MNWTGLLGQSVSQFKQKRTCTLGLQKISYHSLLDLFKAFVYIEYRIGYQGRNFRINCQIMIPFLYLPYG